MRSATGAVAESPGGRIWSTSNQTSKHPKAVLEQQKKALAGGLIPKPAPPMKQSASSNGGNPFATGFTPLPQD